MPDSSVLILEAGVVSDDTGVIWGIPNLSVSVLESVVVSDGTVVQ